MTAPPVPTPRTLTCNKCGVTFGCSLEGGCWCNDESFRLPLPTDGSDCLCPDCLRKLVKEQQAQQQQ